MSKAPLPTYLRTHRKRSLLSQADVAFLVALAAGGAVCRHECGQQTPSLAKAFAYEALFGIPASALFAREYEKARKCLETRAIGLLRKLTREGTDSALVKRKCAFLEALLRRVQS